MEKEYVLITGGLGFIGANFIEYYLEETKYHILNLDLCTYAVDLKNTKHFESNNRYKHIYGDICDRELLDRIFSQYDIKKVINFAAESHVDNSIADPEPFVQSNFVGTARLLNAAYKHWMLSPKTFKKGYESSRFHHISTDEVYGELGPTGYFTENTPYSPNSPYSASKAGSDMMVRAYVHTYGFPATISNSSNNYGKYQHYEKLIPRMVRNALYGLPLTVHGSGKNTRDWLCVKDHASAIDLIFHKGKIGETYLVGSNHELTNLEMIHLICEILDELKPQSFSYKDLIVFVSDRPGNDFRYAIDATKLQSELGWKSKAEFKKSLTETITWFINYFNDEID